MSPADKRFSGRYLTLVLVFVSLWLIVLGRLYTIQVVRGDRYRQIGKNQVENKEPIPAIRGNIYDRNDRPFTMNVPQYSFGVRPDQVTDKQTLAAHLTSTFGGSRSYFLRRLSSSRPFLWLERNVEKQKVQPLLNVQDPGLVVQMHNTRYYPYQEIGAQLVGTMNVDGAGITGLEAQYNSLLEGKPGWTILKKDGRGISLPSPAYPTIQPIHGHDIELTIDLEYQTIVEEALTAGLEEYKAVKGMAVLMDPGTGAILAMASAPTYDPNSPAKAAPANMKNRAVTDIFEPGSTFKIVTATAALAEHKVRPEDLLFCEQGKYRVNGEIIHDWKPFGWLSFSQVIINSSNIGTIKIAEKLGRDVLYRYVRRFGFGTKTGVNFIGEVPGITHPLSEWTNSSLASIAIGHEVSVTALQLANAFAAVANDGYLMQPYLVRRILDENGKTVFRAHPEVIRQVAKPPVMRQVKAMLKRVVTEGTGVQAAIDGIQIAGKTGTAQKLVDGKYSEREYLTSFVGFLPADNPKLLCAVILDSPEYSNHWGGHTAAPIAKTIFTQIINSTDEYYFADNQAAAPGRRVTKPAAPKVTAASGKQAPVVLTTQMVLDQPRRSTPETTDDTSEPLRMPDVRGQSLRDALVSLYDLNLEVKISGYGRVARQLPKPGTHLKPGTVCKLELMN